MKKKEEKENKNKKPWALGMSNPPCHLLVLGAQFILLSCCQTASTRHRHAQTRESSEKI